MATGEQPFPGESMTAVSYKVVHTEPVPPRKLNPAIPLKLEGIILKCLAKNPDERYQTGEELARDLGELRTVSTSMGLKSAVPEVAAAGSDPNATFIETRPATESGRSTASQPPDRVVAHESKSKNLLVLAALVVAVIVAGSWYISRHNGTPAANVMPPPPTAAREVPLEAAPSPATANESVAKPLASAPKKQETKVLAAPKPTTPKAVTPVPKSEPVTLEPAAVDFNPKSLDPKYNAKLKIDAGQIPASLDFTVEMNGKLYLRRSAEGNKTEFDDLYVPPGVQEFRVTAGSGSVQKSSNTVSIEFKAKKRNTMKIELRTQGTPTGMGVPQAIYADSQIVLTLK
jgi:serine/threonine-protein kinase